MKDKHLHFNNHLSSKQSLNVFAVEVLIQIMENPRGYFTMSVDDGDGDLYQYKIFVHGERVKNATSPITEN